MNTIAPVRSIGRGIELFGHRLQNITGRVTTPEQLDNFQEEHKNRSTLMELENHMVTLDAFKSSFGRSKYRFGERAFKEEAKMTANLAQAENKLKVLDVTTEMCTNSRERRLREKTAREAEKLITRASRSENKLDQCYYRSDAAEATVECIEYIREDLQYLYEDVKEGQIFDTENLATVVQQIGEISHVLTSDINSPYAEKEISKELQTLHDTTLALPFMEASHKLKMAEIMNRVNPVVEKEDGEVNEMREKLRSHLDKDVPERIRE